MRTDKDTEGLGRSRCFDSEWPVHRIAGKLMHLCNHDESMPVTKISESACRNLDYKCQMRRSNSSQSFFRLTTMLSNLATPYATVVSLASFFLVFGICRIIFAFVYDKLTSPLRHVPGPPSPSFIYGNMKQHSESVS